MTITSYQIVLARPSATYFAGEYIEGQVQLVTTAPIKCRGVRLKLQGESRVHWKTTNGNETEYHTNEQHYLSRSVTCFGNFYRTVLKDGAGANPVFDTNKVPTYIYIYIY